MRSPLLLLILYLLPSLLFSSSFQGKAVYQNSKTRQAHACGAIQITNPSKETANSFLLTLELCQGSLLTKKVKVPGLINDLNYQLISSSGENQLWQLTGSIPILPQASSLLPICFTTPSKLSTIDKDDLYLSLSFTSSLIPPISPSSLLSLSCPEKNKAKNNRDKADPKLTGKYYQKLQEPLSIWNGVVLPQVLVSTTSLLCLNLDVRHSNIAQSAGSYFLSIRGCSKALSFLPQNSLGFTILPSSSSTSSTSSTSSSSSSVTSPSSSVASLSSSPSSTSSTSYSPSSFLVVNVGGQKAKRTFSAGLRDKVGQICFSKNQGFSGRWEDHLRLAVEFRALQLRCRSIECDRTCGNGYCDDGEDEKNCETDCKPLKC